MKTICILISIFFAYFTNKSGSTKIALSEDAISRRAEYSIPIDSLDYAVSPVYLDSLKKLGVDILHTSRWLNGVTFRADDAVSAIVAKQSFVKSVQKTKKDEVINYVRRNKLARLSSEELNNPGSFIQLSQIGVNKMHEAGYKGKNIKITVIDNGFLNVDINPAFDSIRPNIIDTFNLVPSMGGIYEDGDHGAYCLSLMAANIDLSYIGAAPKASYYLVRGEDDYSESMWEVDNQTRGFEIADSVGADIISSSLGYATFDDSSTDFTYADMNGKTARNSIAANIAARKGIIVCIAAGNEGNDPWRYISSPADADSILAVGSVTSEGNRSSFSSYGPSSDGRIKPDVAAMGTFDCIISVNGPNITWGNGTSFATPLVAGMTACLWEALPQLNNMQIIQRIKDFASQHNAPDNELGYGIANAWFSLNEEIVSSLTTYSQPSDKTDTRKVLINGQIFIIKDGTKYTILGEKSAE